MSYVIIDRKLCDWEMVYMMFFLGRNFVSGLLCTLKPKNISEKSSFFQPTPDCTGI